MVISMPKDAVEDAPRLFAVEWLLARRVDAVRDDAELVATMLECLKNFETLHEELAVLRDARDVVFVKLGRIDVRVAKL